MTMNKHIQTTLLSNVSPKSFRNGLTLEVMPGIGNFPRLEDPQWISERLIGWGKQSILL